jgi:hypothetical protein
VCSPLLTGVLTSRALLPPFPPQGTPVKPEPMAFLPATHAADLVGRELEVTCGALRGALQVRARA